jgi:formate dehydrogenase iron-sulfur subunit
MDRRRFFQLAGAAGVTLVGTKLAQGAGAPADKKDAGPVVIPPEEFVGVLTDTTRCIGCRACEVGCGQANGMLVPDVQKDKALERVRETSVTQWTVVNRYETSRGAVFAKRQCFHCWQPACASACLTNAMLKTKSGPVIWREDKCMGCRYCMVSCPFNIPKFEYDSTNPKVQKCILCHGRTLEGKKPACVEACPTDALMYGKKRELMEIARNRIYNHPDQYHPEVYGEHVAGGTGWLYLASVPFGEIGLPTNLGTTPFPEYTREFLYSVPMIELLWPTALLALNYLTRRSAEATKQGSE